MPAIRVERLAKRYGNTIAVEDVSFAVAPGEIFCLVGPNGAGKTTTVECIEGHTRPDGGVVRVFGLDPANSGDALKRRIGVQLQESNLPDRIKVWEALDLFASLYDASVDLDDLMQRLGIDRRRDAYFTTLSGGEKQRLFVALALVNDPELIFLDELTTGLDPHARRTIWALLRSLRDQGKTILLTTHFMDEAETLADRVAILHRGRVVALDTPERLIRDARRGNQMTVTVDRDADLRPLTALDGVTTVSQADHRVTVTGAGGRLVSGVVRALEDQGIELVDLSIDRPTLEDVFLQVTGTTTYDPAGT